MDEEITVYLENETTQKFNTWLEDCFQKLDNFYRQRAPKSGVIYIFHKPVIDGKDTRSYILVVYHIGSRIERGINLKWVEVGARLKVMITFLPDPKIIHPVLDILVDLHNDFPDAQGAVMDTLRELKNKYQLDDSTLPLDAPLPADMMSNESLINIHKTFFIHAEYEERFTKAFNGQNNIYAPPKTIDDMRGMSFVLIPSLRGITVECDCYRKSKEFWFNNICDWIAQWEHDPGATQATEPPKDSLPEIEDPTDQRIWEWIKEDSSITDADIAQRLGVSRQAVNPRRRSLEKMGYPVRKVSRQK